MEPLKAESVSESVSEQLLAADNKAQTATSDSESTNVSEGEVEEEEEIKAGETKPEQKVNISRIAKNEFKLFRLSFDTFFSKQTEYSQKCSRGSLKCASYEGANKHSRCVD